jgi:hypothetical protein
MTTKISLDQDAFNHLIRGGTLECRDDVFITLQDIGYAEMINTVSLAAQDGKAQVGNLQTLRLPTPWGKHD